MKISSWIQKKNLLSKDLQKQFLSNDPFSHIVLSSFFKKEQFEKIRDAFYKLEFKRRESDLYQFFQSTDFKKIHSGILKELYDFFSSKEMIEYISQITNTKLNGQIDMSGFVYSDTDYLLVHDDQLDSRKVAFVIQLEQFTKKDGGVLELFDSEKGKPKNVVKSYVPKENALTLFCVTKKSFHQVTEVIKKDRSTITGWFHG